MNIVFIINPQAGNGAALSAWHKFAKKIGFDHEQYVTEYPGHALKLVEAFKERQQDMLVIGFGGDGTMREITAAAAGSEQLTVASISAGSGNDFARTYGCFRYAAEIQQYLQQPQAIETDVGEVVGDPRQLFASSSGIGFDAAVSQAVNASHMKQWLNKIRLGKLSYFIFVVSTLLTFQTFRLTVESNGEQVHFDDVWLATVSNQPYFGGGMKISPQSKTDDGVLELTVVHRLPRLKLLAVFGTVFSGSHTRFQEVVQLSSRSFLLSTDRAVLRHIDGDDAGVSAAHEKLEYRVAEEKWRQAKLQ
ncbi:diacylglycerol kinase family protein [Planococcus sp. ISL-109]|uniref:diacylglycerol/lipid kinase family protein n=1 Tax=Planococcus sp. ISL-109 TaxID=2819166 RepID=UPI001BE866D3|nr:diacylglycerol kinase family protein [Planococcus sp. ISL-109]MBT2582560.1 diacylglycerol kinase family lipid kinase [Planococcus sp. ISL-109]